MLQITQTAKSQKPVNQKKNTLDWATYVYTFLQIYRSKFKIPITTEIC